MLVTVTCQVCGARNDLVLLKPEYHGPFTCYKCRGLAMLEVKEGRVESWQALTPEEFTKEKEIGGRRTGWSAPEPRDAR